MPPIPTEREALPATPRRWSLLRWLVLAACVLGLSAGLAWIAVRDRLAEGARVDTRAPGTAGTADALPDRVLAEHRRAMEEELEGYGWVDRQRGLVRIPIREGMARVLERGLPARELGPESSEER